MEWQWRRCYIETLRDLEQELQQQRQRRHLSHSFQSVTNLFNDDTETLTHLRSSSEEGSVSSVQETAAQSDEESDDDKSVALSDHCRGAGEVFLDEDSASVQKAALVGGSDSGESETSARWSNSDVDVSVIASTLHDVLTETQTAESDLATPLEKSDQVTEDPTGTVQRRKASELEATWVMMSALKEKIEQVKSIINDSAEKTESQMF